MTTTTRTRFRERAFELLVRMYVHHQTATNKLLELDFSGTVWNELTLAELERRVVIAEALQALVSAADNAK